MTRSLDLPYESTEFFLTSAHDLGYFFDPLFYTYPSELLTVYSRVMTCCWGRRCG